MDAVRDQSADLVRRKRTILHQHSGFPVHRVAGHRWVIGIDRGQQAAVEELPDGMRATGSTTPVAAFDSGNISIGNRLSAGSRVIRRRLDELTSSGHIPPYHVYFVTLPVYRLLQRSRAELRVDIRVDVPGHIRVVLKLRLVDLDPQSRPVRDGPRAKAGRLCVRSPDADDLTCRKRILFDHFRDHLRKASPI